MKTAAQLLLDLLDALSGIPEDSINYRSVREANALAMQALAAVNGTR